MQLRAIHAQHRFLGEVTHILIGVQSARGFETSFKPYTPVGILFMRKRFLGFLLPALTVFLPCLYRLVTLCLNLGIGGLGREVKCVHAFHQLSQRICLLISKDEREGILSGQEGSIFHPIGDCIIMNGSIRHQGRFIEVESLDDWCAVRWGCEVEGKTEGVGIDALEQMTFLPIFEECKQDHIIGSVMCVRHHAYGIIPHAVSPHRIHTHIRIFARRIYHRVEGHALILLTEEVVSILVLKGQHSVLAILHTLDGELSLSIGT